MSAPTLQSKIGQFLYNHVFFPRKLPGKPEPLEHGVCQRALSQRLLKACRAVHQIALPEDSDELQYCCRMMHLASQINAEKHLDEVKLKEAFADIDNGIPIVLQISAQNAALIACCPPGTQNVVFEAFEASAESSAVLKAIKDLQWDFPDCAVSVPLSTVKTKSFQDHLSRFLDQASREVIQTLAPIAAKATSSIFESRDTVSPTLITTMLMALLHSEGEALHQVKLRKHIRDDVCWAEGSQLPWRRSSFHLIMRVAICRLLCSKHGQKGRIYYKFIICQLLSEICLELKETGALEPQALFLARAKLARRLVKLEEERQDAPPALRTVYDHLFASLKVQFKHAMKIIENHITNVWTNHKQQLKRVVRPLPYAADPASLILSLPLSRPRIAKALNAWRMDMSGQGYAPSRSAVKFSAQQASASQNRETLNTYAELADFEEGIEQRGDSYDADVSNIAATINWYKTTALSVYEGDPEQKSLMLLTIMDLWTRLDAEAIALYPLLQDYDPGIPPDILQDLHILRLSDMERLQHIEQYLKKRKEHSDRSLPWLFGDPAPGSFADRFFEITPALQDLQDRTWESSNQARTRKEEEWRAKSLQYEDLAQKVSSSACIYTTDESGTVPIRVHNERQCPKCVYQRDASRLRITIHEEPLPQKLILARTVLFELRIPEQFAVYRNTTWAVLRDIAKVARPSGHPPIVLLNDYWALREHAIGSSGSTLCLASRTKPFSSTHYASKSFPCDLHNICLPSGLKYGLYDNDQAIWTVGTDRKASFASHCVTSFAPQSPYSTLHEAVNSNRITPNQIIASQANTPSGMNPLEFSTLQDICCGANLPWIRILRELESTNLNFSNEGTVKIISRVCLRAGLPANDVLRAGHWVFREHYFCTRLIASIQRRLDSIANNWREAQSMELLTTLVLRLCSLSGAGTNREAAIEVLMAIRSRTLDWVRLLRKEVHHATDAATSEKRSSDAWWAAILCRRTFVLEAEINDQTQLSDRQVHNFVESSITLQDNSTESVSALSAANRRVLLRDRKIVQRLRPLLKGAIDSSACGLEEALHAVWPSPDPEFRRGFTPWSLISGTSNDLWITAMTVATTTCASQTVHYEYLSGSFLVQGRPLGKLPEQYRTQDSLRALFGNRALLTYPSGLPGMSYVLAGLVEAHQVHFGFEADNLVVRVLDRNSHVLQHLPQGTFTRVGQGHDLPRPLVDGHVHWLNLNTNTISIRPEDAAWWWKPSNWVIDLATYKASRRNSQLVDPHSMLLRQVEPIFRYFESVDNLLVHQPQGAGMTIDLGRFELSFTVQGRGVLHCSELNADIDFNQEIGTLHGLRSFLVLKDTRIQRDRKIIVPVPSGVKTPLTISRDDFHVQVVINFTQGQQTFSTFGVNEVLNRLDCPAEPLLLCLRAALHASTSFVIPDNLTGRTGVEEALGFLNSASAQPWRPLSAGPLSILHFLADLSPKAEYYPIDLKKMQKIIWADHMTCNIQHDDFRPHVERIINQSNELLPFYRIPQQVSKLADAGDTHLLARGRYMLHLLQPWSSEVGVEDVYYQPYTTRAVKDRRESKKLTNILEVCSYIGRGDQRVPVTRDIASILHQWPQFSGYAEEFQMVLLTDCINLDLPQSWGALHKFCMGASSANDRFGLLFLLSPLTFGHSYDLDVMKFLAASVSLETLKALEPPQWPTYSDFRSGECPSHKLLLATIEESIIPFEDEETIEGFRMNPKQAKKLAAAKRAHQQKSMAECDLLARHLLTQWPCARPSLADNPPDTLINIDHALEVILPEWGRLFQNHELSLYVKAYQNIIASAEALVVGTPALVTPSTDVYFAPKLHAQLPDLTALLSQESRPSPRASIDDITSILKPVDGPHSTNAPDSDGLDVRRLALVVREFGSAGDTIRQQYAKDLERSLAALRRKAGFEIPQDKLQGGYPPESVSPLTIPSLGRTAADGGREKKVDKLKLDKAIQQARSDLDTQVTHIRACISGDMRAHWLIAGGLWPALTSTSILRPLRSCASNAMSTSMRVSIVQLALLTAWLQRLLRVERAFLRADMNRLLDELSNEGHKYWNTHDYPDWLLLEIESNQLIRPDQVEVALQTIDPSSKSNAVVQMEMGKGKTSCIIPMAAAVLGNGHRLVRIIVPKPLLLQMAQLLQGRLGGLLDRPVKHVPFARRTKTAVPTTRTYYKVHCDTMKARGVMVTLPEHMLSFKLSGLLSDRKMAEAGQMLKVQAWLSKYSRDILDECDHTLSIRTQLVYPSGSQTALDGAPHRWLVIEAVLQLVSGLTWNLQAQFKSAVEIHWRPGRGYPEIFFIRREAEEALMERLLDLLCQGHGSVLPVTECSDEDIVAIRRFVSEPRITKMDVARIEHVLPERLYIKHTLFLLRGLFVHRILLMALSRRWNVQYGIDPSRDPIAVPYHAKGVPSEQAEWGHPDVAILFTILSFYYQGLSIAQLVESLAQVLRSDDPSAIYDRWTQNCPKLPDSLRDCNGLNIDDEVLVKQIHFHLGQDIAVIDHYLNNFVFPKHAKQFNTKIQASGWDIPLFDASTPIQQEPTGKENNIGLQADGKSITIGKHSSLSMTTGFSGTNDNRNMLPLNIQQQILPTQAHTNAVTLSYLLQDRNSAYHQIANHFGTRLSEEQFLVGLEKHNIRVLIDAGAQILEMDNLSLIQAWLKMDTKSPAGIYFASDDKAMVYHRDGYQIPLLASPFAEDTGDCLVYLDQVHTRGTDLKMPSHSRGCLTIGPGQTKDHTVQAAMRLRQLATTQSIVFFAPPEVHHSILDLRKLKPFSRITSQDVIFWLMEQTCRGMEQLQPLYISQGNDYCRKTQSAINNTKMINDEFELAAHLRVLEQPEAQTLQMLYGIRRKQAAVGVSFTSPAIKSFSDELQYRRENFNDTGEAVHASALQEVEQEREVAIEVETVREVQKPLKMNALPHTLSQAVQNFASTGRMAPGSEGIENVFDALRRTATGLKYGVNSAAMSSSRLHVTADFIKTIQQFTPNDNYQRPCQWILVSPALDTALIVSPFEAERLLPAVRDAKNPTTHLCVFSPPVTRAMLKFNDLTFYAVPHLPRDWRAPRWLSVELGIFAGRLYFPYRDYRLTCRYLGVQGPPRTDVTKAGLSVIGESSKTNAKDSKPASTTPTLFTKKPLLFLNQWISLRRKGQDFAHTPMGYMIQSKELTREHPFFPGDTGVINAAEDEEDNTDSELDIESVDGVGAGEDTRAGEEEKPQPSVSEWYATNSPMQRYADTRKQLEDMSDGESSSLSILGLDGSP